MKTLISVLRWPIICLIVIAALCSCTQGEGDVGNAETFKLLPSVTPGEEELPECLEDLNITVRSNPSSIMPGQSSVVSWSVDVPFGCVGGMSVQLNGRTVEKSGSQTVTPSSSSVYIVTVSYRIQGVHAESTASTTISVANPAWDLDERGCPKTPEPRTIEIREANPEIDPNHHDLVVQGLMSDIRQANTTILLGPEVVLDFSHVEPGDTVALLWPGPCVTLTSAINTDPTLQPARTAHSLGPQLIFGRHRGQDKSFIMIDCPPGEPPKDNVRISGFQLIGPDTGQQSVGDIGIRVNQCVNVEISNMEILGWGGAGIKIEDDPGPSGRKTDGGRITAYDQIRIHHNYIHHNQQPSDGEHAGGYGVNVGHGAWAVISENVFDDNRHSITAAGDTGGYLAERNLVLKGGGYHGGFANYFTHSFDVHGTGCWWDFDAKLCGDAGIAFGYLANAFQYRKDFAIKIRGKPAGNAYISGNVFPHPGLEDDWLDDAIHLDVSANVTIGSGNVVGYDSFGEYGVCDFDGDAVDDLFLATGATWWFSSYGEFQWTYLSNRIERLDQVRLGYFDDDLRCDVLTQSGAEWVIASGGIGPWQSIGAFGAPLSEVQFGRFDPSQPDPRPGVTRRTTHAFRRGSAGEWFVASLSPRSDWRHDTEGSKLPMRDLKFGDFTGDGVTDVLAVVNDHWAISESGLRTWRRLNSGLGDPVENLVIANMDADDNIDDILRLERDVDIGSPLNDRHRIDRITLTWWRSKNGTESWKRWKSYEFKGTRLADYDTQPRFGFAGRFGFTPGGGTLIIDQDRKGHFYSEAKVAAGRDPDWTSQFPY